MSVLEFKLWGTQQGNHLAMATMSWPKRAQPHQLRQTAELAHSTKGSSPYTAVDSCRLGCTWEESGAITQGGGVTSSSTCPSSVWCRGSSSHSAKFPFLMISTHYAPTLPSSWRLTAAVSSFPFPGWWRYFSTPDTAPGLYSTQMGFQRSTNGT